MSNSISEITTSLLKLSLKDLSVKEFSSKSTQYLLNSTSFVNGGVIGIALLKKGTRTLELITDIGLFEESDDIDEILNSSECAFMTAARRGETTILNCDGCPDKKCSWTSPKDIHVFPLKVQNSTFGILCLALSENDSPSDKKLNGARLLADTLAEIIFNAINHERHKLLTYFAHENPSPLIECAPNGEFLYTNPAVKKILWQHSIDISELLSVNHQDFLANAIASQLPETVISDSGESSFLWSYQYVPETDKILIFGTDISSQKRIENQLAYDSMFDHLTGLPNRNHLLSQIRSELSVIKKRSDYTFALLLINLDRFKTIIESLGFTAGNTALKTVAERLAKWNNNDNLVARLDGDEFAVIIEDMPNMSQIMDVANAIKVAISKDIIVKKHTIRLTESIGIAIGNTNSKSAEELLQNASAAVYRAKRQGTNHTEVYDKEMHLNALARLRVSNELNDAIDNGDLKVYYQPVFGLHDLRVRGFEALARWEHPIRGLIGPGSFISIAEDSGLIHKLGKHVIKSICAQLYKWQNDKLPLAWVSVNVSAHQFKLNHLVSDIISIITEEKADPYRLFVEITEGTAAESPERAFKMMVKLREHGIRIALDDFGTGYSSMSYLKRFPIDALKIDKSFVDGLPENQEDVAIVTSVITMAQALGMKVVAEGVEDERQAMFLRAQNCDEVQGFLYGKPMPAIKATALLKSRPYQDKKNKDKTPIGKIKLKPIAPDHKE